MMLGGPLVIGWTRAFSPRRVIFIGAVLYLAASLLASFSQKLWQFVLTQGMLAGIATCCSYMPAVTVAPMWYGQHRGLAMGVMLAGTGVGGLVFSPMMHALNEALGFRNSLRVSGAITTACIVIGGIVLDWDPTTKARLEMENAARRRLPGGRFRALWDIPLVNWRIARSKSFAAQVVAGGLQAAAYYTPVFFFSAYARTLGYSASMGAGFISVNNAANAVGKIIFGIMADRIGRINMLVITTAVSALSSFVLWLPSTLTASLVSAKTLFVMYTVVYGATASAYVSLFPAALIEVYGPQNFASVNGVLYMVRGMGNLVGTPSAGAMIRNSTHAAMPSGYLNMSILVGSLLAGATGGVIWLRVQQMLDK
jgi:MFS family permease